MSEARFTPGPWVQGGCDNGIIWASGYRATGYTTHPNDERGEHVVVAAAERIPTVTREGDPVYRSLPLEERDALDREGEANAHLIAAAPSLYEALEECVAVLTDEVVGTINHDDPDWYLALDRAVATARTALRLARGEEDGE